MKLFNWFSKNNNNDEVFEDDVVDDEDEKEIHDYQPDTHSEWINGAYDDEGNAVFCSRCNSEMTWNPLDNGWICENCETRMSREEYFNYIGADLPGDICIHGCDDNYPICKRHCPHYIIDENDPMFT